MPSEKPPPDPWDLTWEKAFNIFASIADHSPQFAAMRDVISQLKTMPEVRGLFIKSSMYTAFITPYSCYPDFFDGRRITIDAGPKTDSPLSVRYLRNGLDRSPDTYSYPTDTAAKSIAALCSEYL